MDGMNSADRKLPHVEAAVNYAGRIHGRARVDALDPSRNNFDLAATTVPIYDAMDIRDQLDLDREGFACIAHESQTLRDRDIADIVEHQERLECAYHDELARLVRRMTKADVVLPHRYGLTVRVSQGRALVSGLSLDEQPVSSKTGMPLVWEPALMAHADYTEQAFNQHVAWLHTREGVSPRSYSRSALYHVWRPLSQGPHDKPLAVSDGRTAARDGHVPMDAVAGPAEIDGNAFETRIAAASPDIRWYYFSRMTPADVIVFKGFDTKYPDQTVFHTAFVHPDAAQAIARSSIETRLFAFWY